MSLAPRLAPCSTSSVSVSATCLSLNLPALPSSRAIKESLAPICPLLYMKSISNVSSVARPHLNIPFQLHPPLAARFASFARQRSYGYASLRELPNRTRQNSLRFRGNIEMGSSWLIPTYSYYSHKAVRYFLEQTGLLG